MKLTCSHLGRIPALDSVATGCEECLAAGWLDWLHLWVCQECGHVGCCDQSPGRHSTVHFQMTAHFVARSYEEDRFWCHVDGIIFELEGALPALPGPTRA
jgi:Zn-finger in ubiquitin-hydrolases and other protein